jgi:hypothetical protein
LATLNLMFRLGTPPKEPLAGPYDGILVSPSLWRPAARALSLPTSAWTPWVGKRFDADAGTGDNLLRPRARLPMRALWPGYQPEEGPGGLLAAFRFRTYTAPGMVDPDRETLKIDYDSDENPRLVIRDVLDELVEIVPSAYLGKVLIRRGDADSPRWQLVGYFALEPPAPAPQPGQALVAEPERAAVPAPPTG